MKLKSISGLLAGFLALTAGTAALAQTYSNAVMSLSPVGYWPLNETTPPPAPINLTAVNFGSLGVSGNGFYGAWYQAASNVWYMTNNIVQTTGATSDGDKAMNCQYAPGQYIVLPRNTNGVRNAALTINAPFSIEAWVNPGTVSSRLGGIVSEGEVQLNAGGPNTNNPFYGGGGTTTTYWAGFALGQYSDYFFFSCFDTNAYNVKSSELDGPKTLVVGQWVHLVCTFDGATETMYENGVQVGSKALTANAAGLKYVPDLTSPLMIGSGSDVPASYGTTWTGGLDEVAIYTNILPLSSITAHYQTAGGTNSIYGGNYTNAVLADNPLIYFRMDDPVMVTNAGYPSASFPVANNYGSSSTAGNGVYQPGTTPGVAGPSYAGFGANSKAVAINGWLGAVDVGNSNLPASLNPTGTVAMTVVSWFQTGPADAPGRFQEIVGHSDTSYRLALGQVAGENHFNPGPGPELQFTTASSVATNGFAFNDGNWHMVAGVSDGTNEYMYMDGALAQSSSNLTGINIASTNKDLLLGGDPEYTYATVSTANTIRNFDGQIAHVAFWTNALTAGQIQALFAAAGAPPYIWQQPQKSVTNNSGQNVSISPGLRGSAPLSYQWYQNGVAVAGQTNATLSYSPVGTANAGSYYLVATNFGGSVTSSVVTLVIFGPPTVLQQPATQMNIFAGSSPNLQISAAGATPIHYQWTLNGTLIAGATNSAYTVTNVQAAGTFGCTLSNQVSTAAINPVAITVLADPAAPYPRTVLSDGPLSYERLDETSGTVAYDYVGGYNGIYTNTVLGVGGYNSFNQVQSDPNETAAEFGDYPPNNDYAGNFSPYLNFGTPNGSNAEFSVEAWVTEFLYENGGNAIVALGFGNGGEQFDLDTGNGSAGTLRFLVRNAAGTASTAGSANQLKNDGLWHHVVGVCDEAGGHVYLYLDGNQVASGTITAGSGLLSSATPMSIGARQSGNNGGTNYDFQFIGDIDDVALYPKALSATQVQNHFLASGIAPFAVQVQPVNVTTNQGANLVLTGSAQGTAPLGLQWYDPNNNPLPGQTNATLVLNNLQQNQSGNYTLTVTNLYGSVSVSANVSVVLGPPQFTQNITPSFTEDYQGNPVSLSVQVSGSQPFAFHWYQDGSLIPGATNNTYTFDSLAGTNYYYCTVTNIYSYSQGSGPITSGTATVVALPVSYLASTNYNSNLKITFAGYNRGETLADFPVLVRLSASLPGFSYAGFASPTGGDLRFASASGAEIPYEVDQWNDSNGVSSVWVQVPVLAGTNAYITAYWGNPAATNPPAYSTNGTVWVPPSFADLPPYDLVYHLKENGFPYYDSTLNYPSTNGIAPVQDYGIVGNGELFNGTSTYLNSGPVSLGSAFTVSAWINLVTNANNIQCIVANQQGGYGSAGFAVFVNDYNTANQAVLVDAGDGVNGSEESTAAGVVSFGHWHLITAELNLTNAGPATIYVDGAYTPMISGGNVVTDFPTNAAVNFGRYTNAFFFFTGTMDETRIHAGLEDSNWVWASYQTVASNSLFAAYSPITNSVAPVVLLTIQPSAGNVILTWPQGTLQSASVVTGPYANVPNATSPFTNAATGTQQYYRVRVQ